MSTILQNTVIIIKYSDTNSYPTFLNTAEPAYSNVSNKLFIGDGTGSFAAIGGKHYTDIIDAATWTQEANTLVLRSLTGEIQSTKFLQGNIDVLERANLAFEQSNSSYISQNTTGVYANAAYFHANTSYLHANAAYLSQNTTGVYANSVYLHANAAYLSQNTTGVYANTSYLHANSAYLSQNTTGVYANTAYLHVNAAFDLANTKFSSSGGTITGDVVINSNLTVSGLTTYVNTQTILVGDNIITLNADIPPSIQPLENAGIEVSRGLQPNAQLIWIESANKWSANNGNSSYFLGSDAAESYANSAYIHANSSYISQNTTGVYANSAYSFANTANAYFFGVNAWQNTAIDTAGSYANSAYLHANSSYVSQNTTGVYANSAYIHANSAYLKANTAAGNDGEVQLNYSGGFGASENLKFSNTTNTLTTNNITAIANVGFANTSGALKVYQFYNSQTNSLDTVFL